MSKSVEIVISGMEQIRLKEGGTNVKGMLVKSIDITAIQSKRQIILNGENNKVLSIIHLPDNALVLVDY